LARGKFSSLYKKVHTFPLGAKLPNRDLVEPICHAVDVATIWYWKEVLCLQRSAAAVCLLKHYGVPAEMVIGAQQMPFKAHAWVEVDGVVVNDKPYTAEIYTTLDRC
jgi:hypothetical protein